jgi:hypothetical protein
LSQCRGERDPVEPPAGLDVAQQREAAVEHAAIGTPRHQRDVAAAKTHLPHDIAFVAKVFQRQAEPADVSVCRGRQQDRMRARTHGKSVAGQPRETAAKLVRGGAQRCRLAAHFDRFGVPTERRRRLFRQGAVAHPEVVAVLRLRPGRTRHRNRDRHAKPTHSHHSFLSRHSLPH